MIHNMVGEAYVKNRMHSSLYDIAQKQILMQGKPLLAEGKPLLREGNQLFRYGNFQTEEKLLEKKIKDKNLQKTVLEGDDEEEEENLDDVDDDAEYEDEDGSVDDLTETDTGHHPHQPQQPQHWPEQFSQQAYLASKFREGAFGTSSAYSSTPLLSRLAREYHDSGLTLSRITPLKSRQKQSTTSASSADRPFNLS